MPLDYGSTSFGEGKAPGRRNGASMLSQALELTPEELTTRFSPKQSPEQPYVNAGRMLVNESATSEGYLVEPPRGRSLESVIEQPLTAPIEIWEGEILSLQPCDKTMHCILRSKLAGNDDHVADIELRSVSPQDRPLVRVGAVFYLTLYWSTSKRTTANAEELRFRRLPGWSPEQLRRISEEAAKIGRHAKPARKLPEE